jgi:cation/acetate symporter
MNWLGWLAILGLWIGVVAIALRLLEWLFPRLQRGNVDPATTVSDTLPWYPVAPRLKQILEHAHAARELPVIDPAYWRANARMISALLIVWGGSFIVPAIFAPTLNQVHILTGFPLGYYMGAQGSLIIFLALALVYIWRMTRLDRAHQPNRAEARDGGAQTRSRELGAIFFAFTLGLILFIALIGALEGGGISANAIGWVLLLATIVLYAVIGIGSRTQSLDEYFVAGRRIPAFFNGLAIAGDWMSAASFLSMAGTLWLLGYEGLAYIMGWTGGYVVLLMLLAPYIRKFGQFTIPDFIAARYDGTPARIVSALIGIIISFTYVTAQVTGIGIIMSRFLGVNYFVGVVVGLSAVLFCSFLGGMRAITWTQVAQGIVLIFAYLVPVTLLSLRDTGIALPQLMYGHALEKIVQLENAAGILDSYVAPFNDWTPWNFIALMLCLMLGTAGMPHILIRFYTVPDASAARKSVGWALVFILMLYLTAPAYAAFSRWEVLQNVVGVSISALPEWTINWANAGLLTINDLNSDGILQFSELRIDPDVVVLATPEIAGLPQTIAALVAAGGLAAALSTADGLLMVIASAFSHDFYSRSLNLATSPRARLIASRVSVFLVAVIAAFVAIRRLGIIVQLVAWAFSFAAATMFPVLVLGIFWKRANGAGAIAGMIAGLIVTLAYMILNSINPSWNILGITNVAAGIFGIPANFLVTILISRFTAPPPRETDLLVESLRQP